MPSLRQLQYFIAVSETGHFRLAAEKAGVSQPTLSAQLLALERRLGVPLVERGRAPVVPTAAGKAIMPLAKQVAALVRDIHEVAKTHARGAGGIMKLGLPASIGPYLLPKLLPTLHTKKPDLRLLVREDLPLALPDALAGGLHDLIIAPLPVRGSDFASLRLFREPLYLAIPAGHALANAARIDASDLKEQPILTLERGHALHDQVQAICRDCGARLLADFEGTSLSTLHQMTMMGAGLTFLPGLYALSCAREDEGIKLMTLASRPLHRTIGMAWRASSRDADMFLEIAAHVRLAVKQHFPDFMVHED
jgi:LysR family transcriptional regulator, hydrogen peroxide-inducible genes activator